MITYKIGKLFKIPFRYAAKHCQPSVGIGQDSNSSVISHHHRKFVSSSFSFQEAHSNIPNQTCRAHWESCKQTDPKNNVAPDDGEACGDASVQAPPTTLKPDVLLPGKPRCPFDHCSFTHDSPDVIAVHQEAVHFNHRHYSAEQDEVYHAFIEMRERKKWSSKWKDFACRLCNHETDGLFQMVGHVASHHHAQAGSPAFKCLYCPFEARTTTLLRDHVAVRKKGT